MNSFLYRPTDKPVFIDEDASLLEFGEEYVDAIPLSLPEVKWILEAQDLHRPKDKVFTDTFEQALELCKRFTKVSRPETLKEMRRVLNNTRLEPFEVAQIISLNIEATDECKALVPSVISGIETNELTDLLHEVVAVKKFQG